MKTTFKPGMRKVVFAIRTTLALVTRHFLVMQVTSLLTHHEHGPECGCGHDHEHSVVHLWQAVLGVVFVLNAFIVDWLFVQGGTVASASAFIGAIILGYPIVVTAIKDLRVGRLSINELVAIAVLAAFASGNYKVAGVVAFF